MAKFIRYKMRACGYEFKNGHIFIYNETEAFMQTKMLFSKVGNYENLLAMLSPQIAANISISKLISPPTLTPGFIA